MPNQELVNDDREILGGGGRLFEVGSVVVEVLVIEAGHDLSLQYVLQLAEVDDHSGDGIRIAPERHLQTVVVPVALGLEAESLSVLRVGETARPVAQ